MTRLLKQNKRIHATLRPHERTCAAWPRKTPRPQTRSNTSVAKMACHSTRATSPHALASHQSWLSHVPLKVNNASYDHLVHPCSHLWNNRRPCLLSIRLRPRRGQTLSFDWPTLPTSRPLHLPPLLPHLCSATCLHHPESPAHLVELPTFSPAAPPSSAGCRCPQW